MKTETLFQLGLLGGAAYLIYKLSKKLPQVTEPVANVIADFYTWLTLPAAMTPLGNMQLPDGSLIPIAQVDVRQSPTGNTIAEYDSHFYQLSPSDANGNWPAALIQ